MKKIYTVTLLLFTVLLLLTGCSGKAIQSESEPDTDAKTQVRALTSDQKVVYRFHYEQTRSLWRSFTLNLLDANIDSGAQAQNWLTAEIGDAPELLSGHIITDHFNKHTVADEGGWDISSFASKDWKMFIPMTFEKIKSADMVLTVARQGEIIRLTLDIDGSRAWYVQQKIGNIGDETAYIYLSVSGIKLSNITFSDMGGAGWLPPWWVRLILRIGIIAVAFFLYRAAKKSAAKHFFRGEDEILTFTVGIWGLTIFLLAALIAMHTGVPISRNLYFLPLPLPGSTIGFWIMAVILGILILANVFCITTTASGNRESSIKYLLGISLLSIGYLPWCISVLFLFFDLLNVLVNGFVVFLAFGVIALFVAGAAQSGKGNSGSDGGDDSVTSAQSFADSYRRWDDEEWFDLVSAGDNHAVIKDRSGNYITIRRHGSGGLVIDDNGDLYRPE